MPNQGGGVALSGAGVPRIFSLETLYNSAVSILESVTGNPSPLICIPDWNWCLVWAAWPMAIVKVLVSLPIVPSISRVYPRYECWRWSKDRKSRILGCKEQGNER